MTSGQVFVTRSQGLMTLLGFLLEILDRMPSHWLMQSLSLPTTLFSSASHPEKLSVVFTEMHKQAGGPAAGKWSRISAMVGHRDAQMHRDACPCDVLD